MVPVTSPEVDLVWRITVDERLDAERVRLLIAAYVGVSGRSFVDPIEDWSDETERTIRREQMSGFFGEGEGTPAWEDLREGQVYLVGSIEPFPETDRGVTFRPTSSPPTPHRIDTIPSVEEDEKQLYSDVLAGPGGARGPS